jgi:hypothetical protein
MGGLAWVTWRRGLRLMLQAATVGALTYLAAGRWVFREPWNLHIPIPYFLLLLFLTVLVASGSVRHLITMAVVAALIVQTHLGYALLVAACFAWAIAWLVVDARRNHRAPDRWRSTALIAAGLTALLCLPPIVDVLQHWPGNLGRIVKYFAKGSYAHVGVGRAAGIMAAEFRWVPPWLGGHERLELFTAFAPPASLLWWSIPVALLVLATLAVRRTPATGDGRVVALGAFLLGLAVLAISRADEPRAYTFQWRAMIAAFVVVTCCWAIATAVGAHAGPRGRRVALLAVITLVAVGSIARAVTVTDPTRPALETREPALQAVMREIRRHPRTTKLTMLVRPYGSSLPSLFAGVVDELDRLGADVRVDAPRGQAYGPARVAAPGSVDEIWYVTEEGSRVDELLALPGAHVVATSTPLSAPEEAELRAIQRRLRAQLVATGHRHEAGLLDSPLFPSFVTTIQGLDPTEVARLGALNRRVERADGCRCAIVAVPVRPPA